MDKKIAEEHFRKTLEHFQTEVASIRTGRASPSLVENIFVDYYGTPTPLRQLATITTPESRMILIEAWDPVATQAIEKAIQQSDLGLNPAVDGQRVRVPLPQLTEERRQELVKLVRQKAEAAKVSIRSTREECMRDLKQQEKDGKLSEDTSALEQKNVQKSVDEYMKLVDAALSKKEEDIMKI